MNSFFLYLNTIKYLKPIQIYYRIYYFVRNKFNAKTFQKKPQKKLETITWKKTISNPNSFLKNKSFQFLNLSHQFNERMDWNFSKYGKLWTYNLNYFDFLNQKDIKIEEGLHLINDYIKNNDALKDGKEAYPISLRGINWIKFLSKNNINDQNVNQILYNDYQILMHNLEYHLLGNHLLENGFSLFFAAYYFNDKLIYKKAVSILTKQLNQQLLDDGGHFELSPMYHQILLHRLLDCIYLVKLNNLKEEKLLPFLIKKALKMLSWLEAITYKNGAIPMVNDSAYNIACSTEELVSYANLLELKWKKSILKDSGYRKINLDRYELLIDVGDIKSNYQPGHAHSDIFNFELFIENKPFIVDRGISTYEKNKRRNQERSTDSHNTVMVGNFEQTKVWGGFRVAQRAKIIKLEESENTLVASHNGYKKIGIIHQRKFEYTTKNIVITDSLSAKSSYLSKAMFHFHPWNTIEIIKNNEIKFSNSKTIITFEGNIQKIEKMEYDYCTGFNHTEKATKINVYFKTMLTTNITL